MLNLFLRLIEPMRSQKWRDAQEQKAFEAVFEDIPSDEERKRMSEKELAEVLSTCKAGTPAYILVEHELNLRIAKEQSIATWRAALAGGLFALASAALGAWITNGSQNPQAKECVCQWRPETKGPQPNLQVQQNAVRLPSNPVSEPQPKP